MRLWYKQRAQLAARRVVSRLVHLSYWGPWMTAEQRLASLICVFLLVPRIGFSQQTSGAATVLDAPATGGIEGSISSEEGVGVAGAIVTLEPLRLVEYTDQNGAFAFRNVPPGVYALVVNFGSLEARDVSVRVASGEITSLQKVLPRDFRISMTTTVSAASRIQEQQLEAPAVVSVVDEKTIALEVAAVGGWQRVHPEWCVRHSVQLARLQQHAVAASAGPDRRTRCRGARKQEPRVAQRRLSHARGRAD